MSSLSDHLLTSALSSLRRLNAALRTMTEVEVWELLQQERRGLNRPVFLQRLYGRFKTLREVRERDALFGQNEVNANAQAECLLQMWGSSPLDLPERQQIEALKEDPVALRDLLLGWVLARDTSHSVPPPGWLPGPQAHVFTRTKILLESWEPGQTLFKEPSLVQVAKENLK